MFQRSSHRTSGMAEMFAGTAVNLLNGVFQQPVDMADSCQ
jgi:hypothetical protein